MMKKIIGLTIAALFSGAAMQAEINTSGKSFLRLESPFQAASPEKVSLFSSAAEKQRAKNDRCGSVQFTLIGGRNSNRSEAAAYYMPGGNTTLTFNADPSDTLSTLHSSAIGETQRAELNLGGGYDIAIFDTGNSTADSTPLTVGTASATDLGYDTGTGTAIAAGDSSTNGEFAIGVGGNAYETFDLSNLRAVAADGSYVGDFRGDRNTEVIRPWNFGIGFAAMIQPGGDAANNVDYIPTFKSTIAPELIHTHWGLGASWRQHLSEDATGFWVEASTALHRVKNEMQLNETDISANTADIPAAWSNSGYDDATAPANVTAAFAQTAWDYGKIDGAQSKTGLADIELKLGYQFVAEDNYSTGGYVGLVLPTGNKAEAVYMAEPIVGNGKHAGLMLGSSSEMQLNSDEDMSWSCRYDTDARYLFKNTQKRSLDTISNGDWSRYMYAWSSYTDFQTNGAPGGANMRSYTPGVNLLTKDVYVTPRAQMRSNIALSLESGDFKADFGWNVLVRQQEKVELVDDWTTGIAFVDASTEEFSFFNNQRTIFNDAYQSVPYAYPAVDGDEDSYNLGTIKESDLNLDSASSPIAFTNTPYLALGYAWDEGASALSFGASYEFSQTNSYMTQWMLWGKLNFAF